MAHNRGSHRQLADDEGGGRRKSRRRLEMRAWTPDIPDVQLENSIFPSGRKTRVPLNIPTRLL